MERGSKRRRRRQLPSPQLPCSSPAVAAAAHYQCDMASLNCQGLLALPFILAPWSLNGGGGEGCSVLGWCCFMWGHTLPPVGARRA